MDKQAHEIFKLNATYQVAPDATADDLMEDAALLTGLVRDALAALAHGFDAGDCAELANHKGFPQMLYGLSYLAEMGNRAAVAHALVPRVGQEVQS